MAVGSTAAPITTPLGTVPEKYDPVFFQSLLEQLEQIHLLLAQPAQTGYVMSNVTATRTLNADSTSTAELADVLGTLIDDLKAAGRLSQ